MATDSRKLTELDNSIIEKVEKEGYTFLTKHFPTLVNGGVIVYQLAFNKLTPISFTKEAKPKDAIVENLSIEVHKFSDRNVFYSSHNASQPMSVKAASLIIQGQTLINKIESELNDLETEKISKK